MNKLQACEKRYANLKMLWERKGELNDELLETLENLYEEVCDYEHNLNAEVVSEKTWLKAKNIIAKAREE